MIDDAHGPSRREAVRRLVLCSGKIAIDLTTTAKARSEPVDSIAVARIELLYPFPTQELRDVLDQYPNLREVVWVQEEPQNMGAWTYIRPLIEALLPEGCELQYIGRPSPGQHCRRNDGSACPGAVSHNRGSARRPCSGHAQDNREG